MKKLTAYEEKLTANSEKKKPRYDFFLTAPNTSGKCMWEYWKPHGKT